MKTVLTKTVLIWPRLVKYYKIYKHTSHLVKIAENEHFAPHFQKFSQQRNDFSTAKKLRVRLIY